MFAFSPPPGGDQVIPPSRLGGEIAEHRQPCGEDNKSDAQGFGDAEHPALHCFGPPDKTGNGEFRWCDKTIAFANQ